MKRMQIKWIDGLAVVFCLWLVLQVCPPVDACPLIKFKADRISLRPPGPGSGGFVSVSFAQSYTNPVVFVLPTSQNTDPATVRLRNVSGTGFEMAVVEPLGSDGPNTGMTVDYLVAEAGTYTLPGGNLLEVGTVSTMQMQSRYVGTGSTRVAFANVYPVAPAVLVQIQTTANEPGISPALPSSPWMTATAFNITGTYVDVALERSEDTSGTVSAPEVIGYLAFQSGVSGTFTDSSSNTITYETIRSATNIVGWDNSCVNTLFANTYPPRPIALANKATRSGSDGGWLRRCNLNPTRIGLWVDEDQASDSERGHISEIASIVLFSGAFDALVNGLRFEAGSAAIPPTTAAVAFFTTVSFPTAFSVPPMIFPLPTNEGAAPAALRLRNVTASGFEIAAVEPTGESGPHPAMAIDYIAATPGSHTLPDGTALQVGAISTSRYQSGTGGSTGWAAISFATPFAAAPAVLTQIQSSNSETIDPSAPSVPWLATTVRNISTTGAEVALERAEAPAGTVVAESIGYLAMAGGVQSSFLDATGVDTRCEALLTPANVRGWDNGCYNNSFSNAYTTSPIAVAHQATRNGSNGGWLRRCNLTAAQIGLTVDEDRASDAERSHISESASIIAFSRPFEACWLPQMDFDKAVTPNWDPVSGSTNPKAIPGARMAYTLSVVNEGSGTVDSGTMIITEPIDSNLALFVGVLDTSNGAPVIFDTPIPTDVNTSGLSFTFSGLTSTIDDIDFADDSGFGYVPVPDGDGFDSNVRGIQITPQGDFRAADIGVRPTFSIEFHVRVQ